MKSQRKEYIADESGASAVEYALMAALVAAVIIVAVTALGTDLNNIFLYITENIPNK